MSTPAPDNRFSITARCGVWMLVVFGIQAAILFWISRQTPAALEPELRPNIRLVEVSNQDLLNGMANEDPEILSQPNPRGFSETWLKPRLYAHQPHRWTPPDINPTYPSNLVFEPLFTALASNTPPRAVAFLKPLPKLSVMDVPSLQLQQSNWLEVRGELKNRPLAKSIPLVSTWDQGELLMPTIVQVMVNSDGVVYTGSLIGRSGNDIADKIALKIALETVRFKRLTNVDPDVPLIAGDLVYHWHGNLNSVTNLTIRPR